jgi:membrane protein
VAIVAAAGTATTSLGTGDTVWASLGSVVFATAVFLVGFKMLSAAGRSWREHLPGAIVAGLLFVLLQLVGGYYVGRVVKGAEAVYGLFAVVIGLLSWMHLQARFAVLSAEINAVLADRLWPRSIPGGEPTEVDARLETRRDPTSPQPSDEGPPVQGSESTSPSSST